MFRRRLDPEPGPGDPIATKWANLQRPTCARFGVEPVPADPDLNSGVARNVIDGEYTREGTYPLHGLRHPVEGGTTGWYIWAGEYSSASDFFVPVHTIHLEFYCPEAVPFLALPPGWRFLLAPGHEDVWYDAPLLDT